MHVERFWIYIDPVASRLDRQMDRWIENVCERVWVSRPERE